MSRKHLAAIVGAGIVAVSALIVVVVLANPGETPQPPPPPPYTGPVSHNVTWAIGETTVYATITRPQGDGPYPAVVFVAGTGQTDRDWVMPHLPGTNGSGGLLATELAKQDFVTIRYDKRYAGPGAEENLPHLAGKISLAGHVEELAGAVETLLAQDYVDPDRIYVLSHGEGAFHALNYHLEYGERFAGLVLTAPPARPLADMYIELTCRQWQSVPGAGDILAGLQALVADFLAGKPFVPDPDLPAAVNAQVSGWHEPRNLPFMREILPLDPAELLPRVTVPALVIIGKKDIQVDWQADGDLLQTATAGLDNITYEFPLNANRVLKWESKTREQLTEADALQYNVEGRVLDPETLVAIVGWLRQISQTG
jgi:uncharacterized protein